MSQVQLPPNLPSELSSARLRSGTAARMAGMPVATLRVWERRYGVVAAPKTQTGQRLYTSHDVQRLRLLKELTERGHAIGTIANLQLDVLQALASGDASEGSTCPRLVVVGRTAAQKLEGLNSWTLQATYDDLAAATQACQSSTVSGVDVMLVHLPSLQPAATGLVLALGAKLHAAAIVVLYAFGAETLAESLRGAGVVVRREPATGRELARLILETHAALVRTPVSWRSAPRRFNDEALADLTELPSTVSCECPRHVAELVMQLASFERYSADCTARSPDDAALHWRLVGLAGVARTLFEEALVRLVEENELVLPERRTHD